MQPVQKEQNKKERLQQLVITPNQLRWINKEVSSESLQTEVTIADLDGYEGDDRMF